MPEATQDPLKVFIIYAREDRDSLLELKKQLIPLERRRQIAVWYDGEIVPAAEWEKTIKTQLETAHIILLLLSSDFFASDYIEKKELRDALARHERGEAVVTPVIVRHCLWQAHPEIEKLQVLPDNAHPVYSKRHWDGPDEAFANIAAGIARVVKNKLEAETAGQELIEEEAARRKREAEAAEQKRREEEAARQKLATEMVFVQGGTFTMGWVKGRDGGGYDAEKPAHEVTVKDFYIGKYPVTQAQWRAVMGSDPPELNNKGCDECPVEGVSWNDIKDFLTKLNNLTGKRYRLPTEAEWEYAARGGQAGKANNCLYSGSNTIDEVAWYGGNYKSGNTFGEQKTTCPVGTKKPNELGLYDMSGNVWEWCEDDYYDNYNGAPTDGSAWVDSPRGGIRVLRGGSWYHGTWFCRAANRGGYGSSDRSSDYGFRLARD